MVITKNLDIKKEKRLSKTPTKAFEPGTATNIIVFHINRKVLSSRSRQTRESETQIWPSKSKINPCFSFYKLKQNQSPVELTTSRTVSNVSEATRNKVTKRSEVKLQVFQHNLYSSVGLVKPRLCTVFRMLIKQPLPFWDTLKSLAFHFWKV